MPRTPDEYAVHILLSSGHREEVRFTTIQEFQKWYSGELMPKATSNDFISVPNQKYPGRVHGTASFQRRGYPGGTRLRWERRTILA
jgi:hypothetical protein